MAPTATAERPPGRVDLENIPYAWDAMSMSDVFAVMEAVWESPEHYMERFLVIQTKGDDEHPSQLVKIKLNRVQCDVLDVIKEMWASGEPVRLMVLKARQAGVSTFIQALFFTLVANNPNTTMWVIAHDRGASEKLFSMSELFLDHLESSIQPMVRNRDRKRIRFDNPESESRGSTRGLNSRIYVDQAKNAMAGRSDTIHLLHISERAFWGREGVKTLTSLLNAVPSHAKTIVIQESTANGVDDAAGFHADWKANYGKPHASWRCLFFPWFIHAEYEMEPDRTELDTEGRLLLIHDPDGEMREEWLRDGVEYVNVHGEREYVKVTDAQLRWRRWAIGERCRGDVYQFMQEFPATPEEAFQQSGRPWFDRAGMEAVSRTVTPPIAIGTFRTPKPEWFTPSVENGPWREDHYHRKTRRMRGVEPAWTTTDIGDWWVWRFPERGREYLVAIDSAEGGSDGDPAGIQVFDRHTLEQVAEFNGFLDTDLLAHQAAMACRVYNDAWSIPEVNNTGYGLMTVFPTLWSRIYLRQDPDSPVGSKQRFVLGWKSHSATRNIITTRGANYIREKIPTIRSSRLVGEMRTFVKDRTGVPRASGKNTDDLVICFLLILELAESRPVPLEKESRPITLMDDKSFREHMSRAKKRRNSDRAPYF